MLREAHAAPGLDSPPRRSSTIEVHLVAQPLMAWRLQLLVRSAGAPFVVTGSSTELPEAAARLAGHAARVVVVDLDAGYPLSEVARLGPHVLVLTSVSDARTHLAILNAGARGVLMKREIPGSLAEAIAAVHAGAPFATRGTAGRMLLHAARNLRASHLPCAAAAALCIDRPARKGELSRAIGTLRSGETHPAFL